MNKQRFLLLQGPCSPFFPRLGRALVAACQHVHKIHFSAGDSLYWRLYARTGKSCAFRGPMTALPDFYASYYQHHGITDLVLFGDCRPVHRPAIALARQHGIRVHVFEEGYFRPHWITLESGGVNGYSPLPRTPEAYRRAAASLPHKSRGLPFKTAFWKRAVYDVLYNLCTPLNPLLYPSIQSHTAVHPLREYPGYLWRGLRLQTSNLRARRIETQLIHESTEHPFYLLPLQLNSDAQITQHSPFSSMHEAMLHTLDSYARAAPPETRLAVKLHPLDPGLINYRKALFAAARTLGIHRRVFFLENGNLPKLLKATKGVITVNSTVGSSALIHQRPTIALGTALYALPGLTFQGALDDFWNTGTLPDKSLLQNFCDVVIAQSQLNGGFYCATGIALAVKNAQTRLVQT